MKPVQPFEIGYSSVSWTECEVDYFHLAFSVDSNDLFPNSSLIAPKSKSQSLNPLPGSIFYTELDQCARVNGKLLP
jgi:hypothetical protein